MIKGNRGRITSSQILESINPPDFYHSPKTSLVCWRTQLIRVEEQFMN